MSLQVSGTVSKRSSSPSWQRADAMDADLIKKIHEIQRDPNLSTAEKASKRQELLSGKWQAPSSPSACSPGVCCTAIPHFLVDVPRPSPLPPFARCLTG